MVHAAKGWGKSVLKGMGIKIKKVQPKRAVSKRTNPKKAASKIAAVAKAVPKKAAPKKVAPKKKGVLKSDPVETLLAKMAEMHQIGITEVNEAILLEATGYSGHDSKGYRNAAKQVIKELGYVERSTKDKKRTYMLTESGRNYLLESGAIVVPEEPKSNKEHHEQLQQTLEKLVSAPKAKLGAIFDTLKDGKWHTVSDLLAVSEYGRTDSKGYRNIMSGLKKLDLLEKSGKKMRLNDQAFKFGRP